MLCHFWPKISEKGAGRGYSSQHVKRFGPEDMEIKLQICHQCSSKAPGVWSHSRHALVTLVRQKLGIFLLILHTFGMVRHAPVTVSSRSLGAAGCPNFPEHIDQCHTKETQCSTCLYFFTVTEKSTLSVFLPRGLTIQKKFEGSSKGRSMHLH